MIKTPQYLINEGIAPSKFSLRPIDKENYISAPYAEMVKVFYNGEEVNNYLAVNDNKILLANKTVLTGNVEVKVEMPF